MTVASPTLAATESAAAPRPETPTPRVPRHEVSLALGNALKLGASLSATWTIAILVRFLLPRVLGPARFGELSFAEAFAGGLFALLDLGISTYAMREVAVRPRHASDFFGGVMVLRCGLALALFATMAGVLWTRGKSPELMLAAIAFGVAFALESVDNTLGTFLRAAGRVDQLALVQVIGKLIWGGLLVLALHYSGPHTGLVFLVLPLVLSDCFKLAALYPTVRHVLRLRFDIDLQATRRVLIASFPFFVNMLALSLGGRLNVWVVEAVADPREVGWYSAALNLSMLAMLFTPLFSWVLLPLLARARRRSEAELYWIVSRSLEGFVLAVTPVALFIGLGAETWVRLALGGEYAPAVVAVKVIAVMVTLTYVAMVLSMVLIVLDRSWSLSAFSVGSVLAAPALALVLVPLLARRAGPGGGAAGAAVAATAAELLVVVALLLRIGRGAVDRRTLTTWLKVALAGAGAVVAGRLVEPMGHFGPGLAVGVYLGVIVALGAVRPGDVRATIRSVREARRDADRPPDDTLEM